MNVPILELITIHLMKMETVFKPKIVLQEVTLIYIPMPMLMEVHNVFHALTQIVLNVGSIMVKNIVDSVMKVTILIT